MEGPRAEMARLRGPIRAFFDIWNKEAARVLSEVKVKPLQSPGDGIWASSS